MVLNQVFGPQGIHCIGYTWSICICTLSAHDMGNLNTEQSRGGNEREWDGQSVTKMGCPWCGGLLQKNRIEIYKSVMMDSKQYNLIKLIHSLPFSIPMLPKVKVLENMTPDLTYFPWGTIIGSMTKMEVRYLWVRATVLLLLDIWDVQCRTM